MRNATTLLLIVLFGLALSAQPNKIFEHPCSPLIKNARCGYIEVPEDRTKPQGRKIHIEFVQLRSSAPDRAADAWFDVSGGPGVGATPHASEGLEIFGYVAKHRDMVTFDQRGTGASTPLHCDLYANVPAEELADFLPLRGVERCRQSVGSADLNFYNTATSVQDLEDLRAALGYDKVVLHALSYGTRLSQAYMQAHPDHVVAAIFEGALEPTARIPVKYATAFQDSLRDLLRDCRSDEKCKPLSAEIDLKKISGQKEFVVPTATGNVHLSSPQVFELIRSQLYDSDMARSVPLLLSELSQGDSKGLKKLIERRQKDDPNFSWPFWLSVTCAEDTAFLGSKDVDSARGTLLGDYRIDLQKRACRLWPVQRHDFQIGKPTPIPVLIMEGEEDPVTPPWPDSEVQHYFPNGRQIVMPLVGHVAVGLDGAECIDEIEEQFLAKFDVHSLDTNCLKNFRRKPFLTEMPK
jgi:pimeloyl-ACP methyl ester carboxylesterase